jgi:uncharacterized membrane protein YfcA
VGITQWLLASLVVVLGAVIQGVSGVGGGFIMVPLLALIDLRLLPGALIFSSLSISGLMAWSGRRDIQHRETNIVLLSIIPGAALGSWLLSIIQSDQLGVLFGTMILVGVIVTALGVRLKPNMFNSVIAGSMAGAMGASSGIGAPIIALLYQHRSGPELRATLAYMYTIASTIILLALAAFDQFGAAELWLGLLLMPGMLTGLWISRLFTGRVDRGSSRIVVLVVATISALSLIISSI